jgi:GMP synthase (glutamine-hydrolysing)
MKILLVQIRQDAMREHEYEAIREKMALEQPALVSWNIFASLVPPEPLAEFDAMIIGGSGGYCVSEWTIPQELEAIERAIHEMRALKKPILGICFGHQLLAHALGGRVEMDRERQETGTFEIACTGAAAADPLFAAVPKTFLAQEGHKDHVTQLPPGAVLLATTPTSTNQAFVMPGERMYGVQFHPELSKADVGTRLAYYREEYARQHVMSEVSDAGADGRTDDFADILSRTQETPDAERLLKRFLERIVGTVA